MLHNLFTIQCLVPISWESKISSFVLTCQRQLVKLARNSTSYDAPLLRPTHKCSIWHQRWSSQCSHLKILSEQIKNEHFNNFLEKKTIYTVKWFQWSVRDLFTNVPFQLPILPVGQSKVMEKFHKVSPFCKQKLDQQLLTCLAPECDL